MNTGSYKIYTLGCKVNQCDSRELGSWLQSAGWRPAADNASLAIINSCAVTDTAVRKTKRAVKLARRENPGAKVVLAGCWPRLKPIEREIDGVDLVWPSGDLKALSGKLTQIQPAKQEDGKDCSADPDSDKSRYFIKIQDGCEQFCSYCVVPYARGKYQSRKADDVVREIRAAIARGYREIVLSGIHLGKYGADLGGRHSLDGLIERIIDLPGLGRLRLSSIEVNEAGNRLIDLIKTGGKLCPHLHIPLQSGSDKILRLMNRPYRKDYYSDRIKTMKSHIPSLALTTDIIVGFPGETEDDFRQTRSLVRELGFSRLHVFPFSPNAAAPAARLPGQLSESVKKQRAKELRILGKELGQRYIDRFKNKSLTVLVEGKNGNCFKGKSEYYFDTIFSPEKIIGRQAGGQIRLKQLVKIRL